MLHIVLDAGDTDRSHWFNNKTLQIGNECKERASKRDIIGKNGQGHTLRVILGGSKAENSREKNWRSAPRSPESRKQELNLAPLENRKKPSVTETLQGGRRVSKTWPKGQERPRSWRVLLDT